MLYDFSMEDKKEYINYSKNIRNKLLSEDIYSYIKTIPVLIEDKPKYITYYGLKINNKKIKHLILLEDRC